MHSSGLFLILVCICLIALNYAQENCGRHRRAWHESEEDRDLFIRGILRLYENGRLHDFTSQHADRNTNRRHAHRTSAFLPWHRWFLFEIESQIRDFGGEFECFAMPYWDWSYEQQNFDNTQDFFVLSEGLGNHGRDRSLCVRNGDFAKGKYRTLQCDADECCLRRGPCNSRRCNFRTPQQMLDIIEESTFYGNERQRGGFRNRLEVGPHYNAHVFMGGGGHASNVRFSPDDPLFYLIHSFVDYIWALWQDCHDADLHDASELGTEDLRWIYDGIYSPTDRRGRSTRLDDALLFTELREKPWSYMNKNNFNPTPRDMHDITRWGVSYDKGSFWQSARVDRICDNINPEWFYSESGRDSARLGGVLKLDGGAVVKKINIVNKINKKVKFAEDTFELLVDEVLDRLDTLVGKTEVISTWAAMTCEFSQLHRHNICKRPAYFNECDDMEINEETDDIDINLFGLLNKKGVTQCMRDTRMLFFPWAVQSDTLLGLCRGDYDNFCEEDYSNSQLDADDTVAADSSIGYYLNNNNDHMNDVINVYSELSDFQKFIVSALMNAFLNGVMLLILISICLSIRYCYKKRKHHNTVKYVSTPFKEESSETENDDDIIDINDDEQQMLHKS